MKCTHSDWFRVSPTKGFVPPGNSAVIVLELLPVEEEWEKVKFKVEWRVLSDKPEPTQTAADLVCRSDLHAY